MKALLSMAVAGLCALSASACTCQGELAWSDAGRDGGPAEPGDGGGADGGRDAGSVRPLGPWAQERWVVTPFSRAMGGGPDFGPMEDVGASVSSVASDRLGQLFLIDGTDDVERHKVDIITLDGQRLPLAGTGRPGFRDGPAQHAQFDFNGLAYSPANIQVDDRGNVFVADTGNSRIRRIHQDGQGAWVVDTWAGGGSQTLAPLQSAPTAAVDLPRVLIAATRDGRVAACSLFSCYMVSADGATVRHLGRLPDVDPDSGNQVQMNAFQGDCDEAGVCYFITRSPSMVIRVAPDGTLTRIAGITLNTGIKPHHLGDGPALEVFFDTTPSLVADPSGEAVYVCGGDEYNIRRVPTDGVTTTATLVKNGQWYVMEEHPNGNRGPPEFDPLAVGPSQIAGGELTNLPVAPLLGGDRQGRLYGSLNFWTGVTLKVDGGWLPTRTFRLERR